jgi:hypothetical protein
VCEIAFPRHANGAWFSAEERTPERQTERISIEKDERPN